MDNEYRRKKLKEAWEILKEEFSKDENDRNENEINHASSLIQIFAKKHELLRDPFLDDDYEEDDFFDYVPFDINDFHPITIKEYAEKMLELTQKMEETQAFKNVVDFKQTKEIREDDISVPEIEEIKSKVKDLIELGDYLSIPEMIENISKGMAGHGDIEKLRRMLKIVFEVVDCPVEPRHVNFFNNVFTKRLWGSLNMLQKNG
jgi:hypothetical protein